MMATKDYFHSFLAIIYIYFSSLLACYAFSIICYPCFTSVLSFSNSIVMCSYTLPLLNSNWANTPLCCCNFTFDFSNF
uniref:Putative ovule protein n=1 Tax=Solanum chacoense TaxID=4108 RepID=A0A0V0H6F6_SOLCH